MSPFTIAIKPANILLEDGVQRVKITDFGLARSIDDVTITRTGEVSGTPQYMSPEQAFGKRVDERSDLFSLGAVMYAMCTGRSPFRASSVAAAIRRVCDDTPQPAAEINPEVPRWLSDTIERLLEKDAHDRFGSAEHLLQYTEQQLAGKTSAHECWRHAALALGTCICCAVITLTAIASRLPGTMPGGEELLVVITIACFVFGVPILLVCGLAILWMRQSKLTRQTEDAASKA